MYTLKSVSIGANQWQKILFLKNVRQQEIEKNLFPIKNKNHQLKYFYF